MAGMGGGLALDPVAEGAGRTSVLVLVPRDGDEVAERFLGALGSFRSLSLHPAADLGELGAHDAVLALNAGAPVPGEAEALERFVRDGGTLVALARACVSWRGGPAAWPGQGSSERLAPATELRLRPVPAALTARLDPEFTLRDRLHLDLEAPAGATVLLTADWHLTRRPVAILRRAGAGASIHLALEHLDTGGGENVSRLLHRCLRQASAARRPALGVGLIGCGAIAHEHAAAARAVDGLDLRGVCDLSADRRERLGEEFGVPALGSADELLADGGIDIAVVGTPPDSHAELCLRSVAAGKHVVCEKPLALRTSDVDRMIAAATASERVLTTYQNRRWDADFVGLRRALESGAIGDPFYLEMFVGSFGHPCSYWHSHAPVSGGTLFDWGSHYLDWILNLWEAPVVAVRGSAHKRVWLDVSNDDQVRVDLTFGDGREAMFIHSDVAAALKPKWYVLGTAGAIVGDWRFEVVRRRGPTGELLEDRLAPADAGASLRLIRPDGFGATSEESLPLPPPRPHGFYRNLADHLLSEEDLAAPAEAGRSVVAVMEAAVESIARGGAPVRPDS